MDRGREMIALPVFFVTGTCPKGQGHLPGSSVHAVGDQRYHHDRACDALSRGSILTGSSQESSSSTLE